MSAARYVFNKLINIFLYSEFNIFYIKKNSNKGIEFIKKRTIIYDLFLIKSIFLIIVNKKPLSNKVSLLIFQFPSTPTETNNFLIFLIYIPFVISLYSSSSPLLSSNHFFVSSHLFFFFLFLSLSHKAT